MEITIKIDEEVIRTNTQRIVAESFAPPTFAADKGAIGYEMIRAQVRAYVRDLDLQQAIAERAARLLPRLIDEVLEAELRKRLRTVVKNMTEAGTLFAE